MQFIKDNKLYIGIILIALLGVWFYMIYFSGSSPSATLNADSSTSPLSQDILVTLSRVHTIKLDDTIFKDPIFTSLTDFGVPITPQKAGRRNPFAPL